MKKTLFYFTVIMLLASCNRDKQSESDEMTTMYPAPQTVALNTKEGYKINPVTGDSIQPIINSLGDTIKTGEPVPAKGKVIHPDSVAKPKIIPAGEPKVVPANLNVYKIPETLTVIPVNKDLLKTFTPGVDSSSFVLKNSTGDIVSTGVPIPAKGKVVPCIQSEPVEALLPRIKDNAITNMKFLSLEQGMNSTDVRSMLEDSRGNLWFGTWSGGVSQYNGKTFTHFSVKEGLSDNSVLSCLEDSSGNLWFGTWGGGVSMYDGESFTHFTEKEGLSNNDVWSILEDSSGNLWFGTEGGGVSMYNGKSFTHFTEKEGLSDNRVWSILEDSHGNLWFGTEGGVNMYDGETFTHFTEKDGLSNNVVRSILEDSSGNLWFGTGGGGVSLYNGESFTHFTENEGLSNNSVYSILEDSHGNLWFGTMGGGVNKYNGKSFTHFTENEGLSNNIVYSILEDSHGNLWFGTDSGGVNMYNGETFTHFTEKVSVRSIQEDTHGNLWIGTLGGGVSMYNGESFTHFTENEGLSNNRVRSILEDSSGNIWFGTFGGGVSLYNGETFTHFTENEGLSNNDVWSILEDSSGNIWFGTRGGGVSMYNGEFFTHFTEEEGLSDDWVLSILEDSSGNLWFGTWDGGVSLYNGETFTHFTEKEGLSNHVSSILEDSSGNFWFGTFGEGVSLYNGESFTHFTEKEGLSDNRVWSILEDRNRNIWIGTEKGLNRIELGPDKGKATSYNPVIHTFSEQDGLIAMNFLQANSMLLDSKNRSWWGTGKSLTMLDMNNFEIPIETPRIQLNRIEIKGEFVDYRHMKDSAGMKMEFNSVEKFYNYPLNLKLPYNRNHLTFHFSAIDWSAPHKIRYRFKMEGLHDNWSSPTSEAIADYRNLPHGTYTFKVLAIGAAQKWSEPFEYTFSISPPWWKTIWFRILIALLIVGCTVTYFYEHTRSLRKRKEELEAEVEERTKEAVEATRAKSEFLANMSHELRTPLNAIIGFSEILRAQSFGNINEKQQKYVNHVLTSGKHLLSLINDILDLSKVESGKMELHPSEVSIATLLENSMVLIKEKAMKHGIELDLKIPKEIKNFTFEADERKLKQVVFNLLSNSAKFTPDGGSIETTTWKKGKKLFVCVTDTGIGLKKENLEKVFGKFEQVDSTLARKQEGTGLGLALSRQLIELQGGKIWAESEGEGKGCKFTFVLPISKPKKGKIL